MKRSRQWRGLLFLTATAIPAWAQSDGAQPPTTARPASPQTPARQPAEPTHAPISDADARAFAQSLIDATNAGDRARFNALIDWDDACKTALASFDIPDARRQPLFEGLKESIAGIGGFADKLIAHEKQGGSLSFLRSRQNRGRPIALVRMIGPDDDAGVNYYEFILQRNPDGRIRATDFYAYFSGEFFSETMRGLVAPLVADEKAHDDPPGTAQDAYLRDLRRVKQADQLAAQGKPKEALAIYAQLSPDTRKQKAIFLRRMQIAGKLEDNRDYAAILEEFRAIFPDDPALHMLSIDALATLGDLPGALKAIDQLEKSVGGDPYLDVVRAGLHLARGDLPAARRSVLRSVEREPSLLAGHQALLNLALQAGDHAETLARLKEIDGKFDFPFEDFRQVPEYADFAKSPQHAEWLDHLKARKPGAPNSPRPQENGRPTPKTAGTAPGETGLTPRR